MQTLERKSIAVRVLFTTPAPVWKQFQQQVPKKTRSKMIVNLIEDFLEKKRLQLLMKRCEELSRMSRNPKWVRKGDTTALIRKYREMPPY